METKDFRVYGEQMVNYIANYFETIRTNKPYPDAKPGCVTDLIPEEAPVDGEEWQKIMRDFDKVIKPVLTHPHSPQFHAYYPKMTSYPSLLGDLLASTFDSLPVTWISSPASTELEMIVTDWLGRAMGLPSQFLYGNKGGGIVQSSCSEGTLVALVAARSKSIKKLRESYETLKKKSDAILVSKLVGYCSEQAHSSIKKGAMIALVDIKPLPVDKECRLMADTLIEAVEKDIKDGLVPFFVCVTLGTTSCCSFDDLERIGPFCRQYDIWLHVDAAYAGSAFICPEYRHYMKGIENSDSLIFSAAKWLQTSYQCSPMWVRDREVIEEALRVDPLYMKYQCTGATINYMVIEHFYPMKYQFQDWQIGLTRPFMSLKLWFVLKSFGISRLQNHIRENVRMAEYFEELVRSDDRFEIPVKRNLGLVVFRLRGDNEMSESLLKYINMQRDIYVVPSIVDGLYVIRFTINTRDTTKKDVERDWMLIQQAATRLINSSHNYKVEN